MSYLFMERISHCRTKSKLVWVSTRVSHFCFRDCTRWSTFVQPVLVLSFRNSHLNRYLWSWCFAFVTWITTAVSRRMLPWWSLPTPIMTASPSFGFLLWFGSTWLGFFNSSIGFFLAGLGGLSVILWTWQSKVSEGDGDFLTRKRKLWSGLKWKEGSLLEGGRLAQRRMEPFLLWKL